MGGGLTPSVKECPGVGPLPMFPPSGLHVCYKRNHKPTVASVSFSHLGVMKYQIPSPAPGRVTPRMSRITSTTYGNVAVKYTTWKSHATEGWVWGACSRCPGSISRGRVGSAPGHGCPMRRASVVSSNSARAGDTGKALGPKVTQREPKIKSMGGHPRLW